MGNTFDQGGVKQGDLFNGWPEDGPPDPTTVTIQNLQEDDGYND